MTDLQASIGIHQLRRVQQGWRRRAEIWKRYDNEFLNAMTQQNIGVGVHYLSIPEHPYYQTAFGWKPKQFPHAMRIGRGTVSLPLSAKLSDADVSDVIQAVHKIITNTYSWSHKKKLRAAA